MCCRLVLISWCLVVGTLRAEREHTTDRGCTTVTYIDVDCDGYGVGAPRGPDADDHDPSINTAASWETAYSSDLKAFLNAQRGYSVGVGAKVYYLSPTGNDTTGVANDPAHPYLTWLGIKTKLVAGDVAAWRAGTYLDTINNALSPRNGTISAPILLMAYPGEAAIISGAVRGFGTAGNCITLDGLQFIGTAGAGEGIAWYGNATGVRGLTVRNALIQNWQRGIFIMDGFHDLLIEDSISRDMSSSHTIYLGSRSNVVHNVTVRRNLLYHSGINGIHLNGRMTNVVVEGNTLYGAAGALIALQNGQGGEVVRNNLMFASNSTCVTVNPYAEPGYAYAVPEVDNAVSLFENNTCWTSNVNYKTGALLGSDYQGFYWAQRGSRSRSFKNTVVRNNIIFTHTQPAFWLANQNQIADITFQNNVLYRTDGGSTVLNYGNTYGSDDFGAPFAPSTIPYSLAELVAVNAANTGNITTNPQFVAESTSYVTTPASFDFHLQAGSPAINLGLTVASPIVDIAGHQRSDATDAGVYEYGSSTAITACTTPPVVTLVTPASGATVTGTAATLTATATTSCGTISKIGFAADSWGANIDTAMCSSSPCTVTFDSTRLSPGSRKFWAFATDSYGNSAESAQTTTTITNTCTTAPSVRLVTPASGYVITAGNYTRQNSFLWVNVDPSCGDGAANEVFIDAIKLYDSGNPTCFNSQGQELSCAKVVRPNRYAAGNHQFRAYGADSYGNKSYSAPSLISTTNAPPADSTPPTGVSITSRPAGIVSGTITVTTACADDTACAGMLLMVDGNPVAWVGAEPWSFSLDTGILSVGVHTLSILASDAAANSATSPPLSIVVAHPPAIERMSFPPGASPRLRQSDR